jgi:hypothetical protein
VDIKKDYEKIEYMKKEMEEIENEIQRIWRRWLQRIW